MKKNTIDLSGAELDFWVARAEGLTPFYDDAIGHPMSFDWIQQESGACRATPKYSRDWREGGPIIDRERITFATMGTGPRGANGHCPIVAITEKGRKAIEGATHLQAAMRCRVYGVFGPEVGGE